MTQSLMHYDFHSHTYYSDGVLSPCDLVDRARSENLQLLAISDHDSISGLMEAKQYLKQQTITDLKLINAVELSVQTDFGEIHMVGLNIDPFNTELLKVIELQQQKRLERLSVYEEKFNRINIFGIEQATLDLSTQVVTRSHLARALVLMNLVKDNQQAFKKYIGKKGRIKVATNWVAMEQAILAIHGAGGLAILAHPTRYPMSNRRLTYLIEEFSLAGGDALEVAYPSLSPDKKAWLLQLRQKHDLLVSGGSDFHYPDLKWTDLGRFPRIDSNIPHVIDIINNKLKV
ncbi:MAG: PHP domain-containing protein [Enterobacterales bacterium]|nr:PHP domain-containing protein [Enterobacterales bacterium]